jgi:ubiquitin C-terminal hydrolase
MAATPSGLRNSGSTCYLNALLQALNSCECFVELVYTNNTMTSTRKAMQYVFYKLGRVCNNVADTLLAAMRADIRSRGTADRARQGFGGRQESASEALVLLLELLGEGPTELFSRRYHIATRCRRCRNITHADDTAVTFNLFGSETAEQPASFAKQLLGGIETVESTCERCGATGAADQLRYLERAPPVIVCAFNIYDAAHGGRRTPHYFPDSFELPGLDGPLRYRVMAQIEHSGSENGGHYWARVRRDGPDGPKAYMCNDESVSPSKLEPTENTYLVFFTQF